MKIEYKETKDSVKKVGGFGLKKGDFVSVVSDNKRKIGVVVEVAIIGNSRDYNIFWFTNNKLKWYFRKSPLYTKLKPGLFQFKEIGDSGYKRFPKDKLQVDDVVGIKDDDTIKLAIITNIDSVLNKKEPLITYVYDGSNQEIKCFLDELVAYEVEQVKSKYGCDNDYMFVEINK